MYEIGSRVADPWAREEYVTITGFDSVKKSYSAKTKSGEPMSFSQGPTDVIAEPKKKATPKVTKTSSAPINYIGTSAAGKLGPNIVGEQNNMKSLDSVDLNKVAELKEVGAPKSAADEIAKGNAKYSQYQKALAGASFMIDVMNASSAYAATTGQARLNIMQARNDASDAIYRGRLAQMDRQSEGNQMGQQATLAMAAQGQDVSGSATAKVVGSQEAIGYEMGAREMINAYREALGYELEEIAYEYQMDNAKIERDNAYIGAALNFGTNMAVL